MTPTRYFSRSKRQMLPIGEMAPEHLQNALRTVQAAGDDPLMAQALTAELKRRGVAS